MNRADKAIAVVAAASIIGLSILTIRLDNKRDADFAEAELAMLETTARTTAAECAEALTLQNKTVEVCLSLYPACTIEWGDAHADVLRVSAICKKAQEAQNEWMSSIVERLNEQMAEALEADAPEVR